MPIEEIKDKILPVLKKYGVRTASLFDSTATGCDLMKRDMRLYIKDIWESILAIEEYTRSISEDRFYKDRQVLDAVIRHKT